MLRAFINMLRDLSNKRVAVLKAHGVDPKWRQGSSYKDLAAECQQRFREIPPNRASSRAKTQPRNPLQVTDSLRDGRLVPVRGFDTSRMPLFAVGLAFTGTVTLAGMGRAA